MKPGKTNAQRFYEMSSYVRSTLRLSL